MKHKKNSSGKQAFWNRFLHHPLGLFALLLILFFFLVAIYAPFLASSQPIAIQFNGHWYFPLLRYLFYPGFFTKKIDIFFNLLIFTFPFFFLSLWIPRKIRKEMLIFLSIFQVSAFIFLLQYPPTNPSSDPVLSKARQKAILEQTHQNTRLLAWPKPIPSEKWEFEIQHASPYAQLEWVISYEVLKRQNQYLEKWLPEFKKQFPHQVFPTLWNIAQEHQDQQIQNLKDYLVNHYENYKLRKEQFQQLLNLCKFLSQSEEECLKKIHQSIEEKHWPSFQSLRHDVFEYEKSKARLEYIVHQRGWLEDESQNIETLILPLISYFHWEDQAGGNQALNQVIPWWETTRPNRNDLLSALLFGTRISFVVGIMTVLLSLCIGIPTGAFAGYFGGTFDIIMSRLLEIWESMPTFFMLLLVVGMTQTKSIFITITIIGLFGWTSFCRFTRGEFFKQRNLPYVEACQAVGFKRSRIMFSYILPNAIPPVLTLMPFAVMAAIANEAGLSFLGLGEEGSCSWGILMDEGRNAFPSESYLLWPPALFLTLLLVAIAVVGDALRDTLDPKMHIAQA